jgi:hypothetical protein
VFSAHFNTIHFFVVFLQSVELSRLALYHDPDSKPFKIRKPWDELTPDEWAAIFERGIRDDDSLADPVAVLEGGEETSGEPL